MKKNRQGFSQVRLEAMNGTPGSPSITIVPSGAVTYLWIGDDSPDGLGYATLSGKSMLREFATEILKTLDEKPRHRKAKG